MSGILPAPLPDASASIRGAVSTGVQTWAGVKTFSNGLVSNTVAAQAGATLSLYSSLGTVGSDITVTLGTSNPNMFMDVGAKLLSVQTGIGGTPVESIYVKSGSVIGAGTGNTLSLVGAVADGAGAVGTIINNSVTLANATAKLLSIRNNGTEKAWFDKDGTLTLTGGAAKQKVVGGAGILSLDDSTGAVLSYTSGQITVTGAANSWVSPGLLTISHGGMIAKGTLGAGASDVVNILGSTVADGSVNVTAKLLSIQTGIGGTPVEKSYIDKSGNLSTAVNLTTAQTFSGGKAGNVAALTSTAASIAIDLATDINFSHTLTEDTTLAAPSNPVAGQSGAITFTQHASAPKTLAYNAFWKFPGGTIPTLTAVNSAVDVLTYYVVSGSFAVCSLLKGVA